MPKYQLADSKRRLKSRESADVSSFISSIDKLRPSDKVILWVRVSRPQQKGDLPVSAKRLRDAAQKRGAKIIAERCTCVESLIDFHPIYSDPEVGPSISLPPDLRRAALYAKRRRAILLAWSTDRFVRHPNFKATSSKRARLQPRLCDFEELKNWTDGCRLMTVLDPNATLEVLQSKRSKGHKWIDDRAGWVKRRRERLQTLVRTLRKKLSLCAIRDELRDFYGENLSPETIRQWCR